MIKLPDPGLPGKPGAELTATGARFVVRAPGASSVKLCLFDESDREIARRDMAPGDGGTFTAFVEGLEAGARYGLRADGPWQPEAGHRFDHSKLLVDPYATRLDRPFSHAPRLAEFGEDTRGIVPKAILESPRPPINPGRPVSTPAVFAALAKRDNAPLAPLGDGFGDAEALFAWLAGQRNDLQTPALSLEPAIGEALDLLGGTDARIVRMSGSGATCFALYDSDDAAMRAAQALTSARPGWYVHATHLESSDARN